eukprot:9333312-Prorocentrum_lima.AAC.1
MDLFCSTAPAQMPSVLWDIAYPMHTWDTTTGCYITSLAAEELETGEVEFYLPPALAHWHIKCPHALDASEQL